MKIQIYYISQQRNRAGMCHHSHELLVVIAIIGILIAVLLPIIAALKQGIRTGISLGEVLSMLDGGIVVGISMILLFFLFFAVVAAVMITYEFIKEIGFTRTIKLYAKHLKRLIFRK